MHIIIIIIIIIITIIFFPILLKLYTVNSENKPPTRGDYIFSKALFEGLIAPSVSEPEASERDSSLISKTLLYWGIQSVFLTKRNELWLCATQRFRMRNRIRKELWLSANGRFWMRSRLARIIVAMLEWEI